MFCEFARSDVFTKHFTRCENKKNAAERPPVSGLRCKSVRCLMLSRGSLDCVEYVHHVDGAADAGNSEE